jgi:hypothetical protein
MFRFVSVFFVAAIGAAGYFFYNTSYTLSGDSQPSPTTNQTTSSQELSTQQPATPKANKEAEPAPIALPELTQEQAEQAKAHVESITTEPEKPIEIKKADHFVTAEQVLELPELQAQIIKIETVNTPSSDTPKQVDVIVSAPVKENEQVSLAQSNQNNAQAAQSFAVKIPSFKKTPSTKTEANAQVKVDEQPVVEVTKKEIPSVKDSSKAIEPSQTTNTEKSAPVKVLATVTGTVESKAEVIAVKVNPVKVIPVVVKAKTNITQENHEATIIGTLKKNLEEISDIKVSELASLVTNQPERTTIKASAPKTNLKLEQKTADKETGTLKSLSSNTNNSDTTQPNNQAENLEQTISTVSIAPAQDAVNSQSEKNRIKLKELLNDTDSDKKRIFYLHAVNVADEQGIWGIIQKGLTGTFSKGISLSRANGTIRTLIPEDADEILSNKNSSFLGKLLNYKVLTTYVYNYEKGNIGKNPDYIKPGQQLIIVTFTEQELMSVYQHFKNAQEY